MHRTRGLLIRGSEKESGDASLGVYDSRGVLDDQLSPGAEAIPLNRSLMVPMFTTARACNKIRQQT